MRAVSPSIYSHTVLFKLLLNCTTLYAAAVTQSEQLPTAEHTNKT